jgi:FkbM family methyltransferase
MTIIKRVLKRINDKTIVDAIKNQPGKFKRNKWKKIVASGAEYHLFKHKNLFSINLPTDSELSQYIYQKIFETEEINFVEKFLKKGDYFIDVGTNIGFFSLLAAKIIGKDGKVFSFEPTTNTYNRLLDNIAINKLTNVTAIKKAISDQCGMLELNTSKDGYDAWNSFVKPLVGVNYKTELVETITLDSFFELNPIFEKVKLIKIDIEGWEKFALSGGTKFLSKKGAPAILIEFEEEHTKNAGYDCNSLFKNLEGLGYRMYKIKKRKLILQENQSYFKSCNLIAIK